MKIIDCVKLKERRDLRMRWSEKREKKRREKKQTGNKEKNIGV